MWLRRIIEIALLSLGVFVAITSLIGAVLGVMGGNGWLAIFYGGLGVSMGMAGAVGLWAKGPVRHALLGWFLLGIASRALVDGGLDLSLFSIPLAALLLAALIRELLIQPSVASFIAGLAGGCLAIVSLIGLAWLAPQLPPICRQIPLPGTTTAEVSYPFNSPPWDVAERKYTDKCFRGTS